ncbi:hypothetical protein CROQUDRAFT_652276 [Cronartium quercuum f. sp. fusiforme G11]|uniref:non-specific serine/threonine protein kinase n=1 Tax=Cronartium quercuum f. sp. fusiforme G11 TaxID=708437 RepID=A0A9P6TF88_9BASI|nr:hypothetical protein CROQUDRAFT_652276 [Cronartium quercuum f. sp. fusiforme G11]
MSNNFNPSPISSLLLTPNSNLKSINPPHSHSPSKSNSSSPLDSRTTATNHSIRYNQLHHHHSIEPTSSESPPAYALELDHAHFNRFPMSREPSLPSIMSMPITRPTSPEPSTSSSSAQLHQHTRKVSGQSHSFVRRQYPRTSIPLKPTSATSVVHQRSLSPATNHQLHRRLLTGGAGHLPSSLRTFEEGIRHYERVRSPSLRGHSRRGSWSADSPSSILPPSIKTTSHTNSPTRPNRIINHHLLPPPPSSPTYTSIQNQTTNWSLTEWCNNDRIQSNVEVSTGETYDFDLSDDVGEETLQPVKVNEVHQDYESDKSWSDEDDEDDEYDHEDNEDDSDLEIGHGPSSSKQLPRSIRIFKVGERVGVGTMHQGHRVRDLFEIGPGNGRRLSMGDEADGLGTGLLEIVRQIGVGSYAVVYLVREVLHDPDLDEHNPTADHSLPMTTSDLLSETPKASDGFATLLNPYSSSHPPRRRRRQRGEPNNVLYGRDFALKCLCKRDLSDELLLLQRGEAELHRALPMHENIVALHRALETPNWLFLVIEYCPGQDLFYWLEQARDSQDLESLASRTSSVSQQLKPPSLPPSTTTAATGVYTTPLSAKLLPTSNSIVTPRNLFGSPSPPLSPKPINFETHSSPKLDLPPNTPPSPSLLASRADDEMLSRRRLRLISRMFVQMCEAVEACHKVGVCHRDIKPENFIVVDSRRSRYNQIKPICFNGHHNLLNSNLQKSQQEEETSHSSAVVVKITDWGLGTSSMACEDFDCGSKPYMAYECRNNLHPTYDPIQADVWSLGIVLLNLLYHRCPWADPSLADSDFVEFRRGPIAFLHDRFEGMTPEVSTYLATRVFCEVRPGLKDRVTAGELGKWAKNLLNHMGGGQLHASVSDATIALSPSSARGSQFATEYRSGSGRKLSLLSTTGGGGSKRSSQLFHSILLPHSVPEDLSPLELHDSHTNSKATDTPSNHQPMNLLTRNLSPEQTRISHQFISPLNPSSHFPLDQEVCEEEILRDQLSELEIGSNTSVTVMTDELESNKSSEKVKRRKRGARKNRNVKEGVRTTSGYSTAPVSPLQVESDIDEQHYHLDDLAKASQILAREISQATKKPNTINQQQSIEPPARMNIKKKLNLAERMMEKFRDGGNPDFQAFAARAKAREEAFMGKKSKSNTVSAPAQLQGNRQQQQTTSGFSTISNSTTNTSNSHTSWVSSNSSGHWNSASNRRERLQGSISNNNNHHEYIRKDVLKSTASSVNLSNSDHHAHHLDNTITTSEVGTKTKLAALLTSFKRFNSTLANPGPSSSNNSNIGKMEKRIN